MDLLVIIFDAQDIVYLFEVAVNEILVSLGRVIRKDNKPSFRLY